MSRCCSPTVTERSWIFSSEPSWRSWMVRGKTGEAILSYYLTTLHIIQVIQLWKRLKTSKYPFASLVLIAMTRLQWSSASDISRLLISIPIDWNSARSKYPSYFLIYSSSFVGTLRISSDLLLRDGSRCLLSIASCFGLIVCLRPTGTSAIEDCDAIVHICESLRQIPRFCFSLITFYLNLFSSSFFFSFPLFQQISLFASISTFLHTHQLFKNCQIFKY